MAYNLERASNGQGDNGSRNCGDRRDCINRVLFFRAGLRLGYQMKKFIEQAIMLFPCAVFIGMAIVCTVLQIRGA